MKDECQAAWRSFFLSLDSQSWGKHFHDSGGIHLNLPSSFTYYYITTKQECQVFFIFLEWWQGGESNPLKQGYEPRPDTELPCDHKYGGPNGI